MPKVHSTLTNRQQNNAIDRIKTGQIIGRLSEHIEGTKEMSATQIRAAEILLKRTLPELKSVEMAVEGNLGVTVEVVNFADQNTDD